MDVEARKNWKDRTGAGMSMLAPVMPLLASVALVFLYVPLFYRLDSHHWSVATALAVTLSAWVALGWLFGRSDVKTGHSRVFLGLVGAVLDLDDLVLRCRSAVGTQVASPTLVRLEAEVSELKLVLGMTAPDSAAPSPGPLTAGFIALADWRSGAGYTELYRRINAIGAQALLVCPLEDLRESARNDYLRLTNSNVPGRDTLQYQLKQAVSQLGDDPETFFERPATLESKPATKGSLSDPAESDIRDGRSRVKAVRSAVAGYRNSRFDGIVRERARTGWTVFAASTVAYAALALAVMAHADTEAVTGAMILFLIGALVGLLNQLSLVSDSVSEVEDYGLSNLRLLQTITLSGLAAVLGLVVVVFGAASAANPDIFPPYSGARELLETPDLKVLFDIQRFPLAVAIAAVFGFTPRLLFSRLESNATRLKLDVKSSETSGGGT